jgi:hypothetical protein
MTAALPSKDIRFEVATDKDDAEMCRVLRENPMEGSIELTLEREPSFHAAATVEGDTPGSILLREIPTGRVVGVGSLATRPAWVNGAPLRLGYLSQLRLEERYRRRPKLVRKGYEFLRQNLHSSQVPLYISTVFAENTVARRFLAAGLPGLPTYREWDTLCTLALPVRKKRRLRLPTGVEIRTGTDANLPDILKCLMDMGKRHQFMPLWTAADLQSEERTRNLTAGDFQLAFRGRDLVGCLATWDQSTFKQTVVQDYHGALGTWRGVLNRLGAWTPYPHLPAPGETMRHATLSHLAFEAPEVAVALVDAATNDAVDRSLHSLTLGLSERHPALGPLRKANRHLEMRSVLYVVHWDDGADAANALDDRMPHLEIATL